MVSVGGSNHRQGAYVGCQLAKSARLRIQEYFPYAAHYIYIRIATFLLKITNAHRLLVNVLLSSYRSIITIGLIALFGFDNLIRVEHLIMIIV